MSATTQALAMGKVFEVLHDLSEIEGREYERALQDAASAIYERVVLARDADYHASEMEADEALDHFGLATEVLETHPGLWHDEYTLVYKGDEDWPY